MQMFHEIFPLWHTYLRWVFDALPAQQVSSGIKFSQCDSLSFHLSFSLLTNRQVTGSKSSSVAGPEDFQMCKKGEAGESPVQLRKVGDAEGGDLREGLQLRQLAFEWGVGCIRCLGSWIAVMLLIHICSRLCSSPSGSHFRAGNCASAPAS